MLTHAASLAAGVVELIVVIWALTSLAEVKRGQARILEELTALKGSKAN
jgi:hypothetical protein